MRDYACTLALQQAYRLFEADIRDSLGGPFFHDYVDAVTHLKHDFFDQDPFFWDYIVHPFQGGVSYHTARSRGASPGEAFLWAVGDTAQFELGPLGQAGIGNNRVSPQDLVITPVAGLLWALAEEWAARRIERVSNRFVRGVLRSLLPAHAFVNLIRGRPPWSAGPRPTLSLAEPD